MLISELASTGKDSSIHPTRKYSLNALLPFVRPSISHPLCSSLTSAIARGINVGNDNGLDLKISRRFSLSSVQHRNSPFKQQSSTTLIPSVNFNPTTTIDNRRSSEEKQQQQKQFSCITPSSQPTSLSSYPREFMRKIERFRFIDDSASSTTTSMTSPIESTESVHSRSASRQLINHAIEQFDNYVQQTNQSDELAEDDEINSLIDGLNSDSLTNGSYSDLNILNYHHPHTSQKKIARPQSFQLVHERSSKATVKVSFNDISMTILNVIH